MKWASSVDELSLIDKGRTGHKERERQRENERENERQRENERK